VHVVIAGRGQQDEVGEAIAAQLEAAGLRVLLDDRGGSPGVAFKDAELIGVPTVLVVGKALADGNVELRDRKSGESALVPVADVVSDVVRQVRS